jgi:hypothetical protein
MQFEAQLEVVRYHQGCQWVAHTALSDELPIGWQVVLAEVDSELQQ